MLIDCKRYGHQVETEALCMCPSCIFWKEVTNEFGYKYKTCIYKNWHPGLKKGKNMDIVEEIGNA